jgi:hypothetical protein
LIKLLEKVHATRNSVLFEAKGIKGLFCNIYMVHKRVPKEIRNKVNSLVSKELQRRGNPRRIYRLLEKMESLDARRIESGFPFDDEKPKSKQ